MNEEMSDPTSGFCALFLGKNITFYLTDLNSLLLPLAGATRRNYIVQRITANE